MTITARSTVVISLVALVVLPANILNFVSASECIKVPQSCEILSKNGTTNFTKTVFASKDKIQIIKSTMNAIEEITSHTKCLSAIQSLMCVSAIHACNNSNNDSSSLISTTQQACTGVQRDCKEKEIVAKTYAGSFCSQIKSYPNSSVCLNITPASNGYCPDNETYKIAAGNVMEFLRKASEENAKLMRSGSANISDGACLKEYKKMKCRTFVSTCSETEEISMESCEQRLNCLQSNALFNKTRLCSNFPSQTSQPTTTIPTTPTPYDFTKGFNTTVTLRLNTPYNSEYSNKSSSLYNSFAGAVTDGLKIAYKNLRGLQGVFVAELVCHEKVAVKHTVVTNSVPIVKVIEARLILANVTSGYLKGKVTEANQACEDKHADHDDDHEDSTNWVYMIVFVCITALLLLAMVLCHQSK